MPPAEVNEKTIQNNPCDYKGHTHNLRSNPHAPLGPSLSGGTRGQTRHQTCNNTCNEDRRRPPDYPQSNLNANYRSMATGDRICRCLIHESRLMVLVWVPQSSLLEGPGMAPSKHVDWLPCFRCPSLRLRECHTGGLLWAKTVCVRSCLFEEKSAWFG